MRIRCDHVECQDRIKPNYDPEGKYCLSVVYTGCETNYCLGEADALTCENCGQDFSADQDYIVCPDCRTLVKEEKRRLFEGEKNIDK